MTTWKVELEMKFKKNPKQQKKNQNQHKILLFKLSFESCLLLSF